jgi:uncharacterized protein with FMN-binding domain
VRAVGVLYGMRVFPRPRGRIRPASELPMRPRPLMSSRSPLRPASWAFLLVLAISSVGVGAPPYSREELASPASLPKWARPVRVNVNENKPWSVFPGSRISTSQMRRGAAQLHYVVRNRRRSPNYPFWVLKLGQHFIDLEQDRAAYQVLTHVIRLPADTPHTKKLKWLPTLDAVKVHSRFMLVRLLARNGLKKEVIHGLSALPAATGYDAVRRAEALAMIGDSEGALALLPKARGGGHPERNFSNVFLTTRAVTLARCLGDAELTQRLAKPLVDRGLNSQKWPQWKSAWSIMSTTAANAAKGSLPDPKTIPEGAYEGECGGFVAPIRVAVDVADGRLSKVRILSHKENRSWSALTVIPQRICRRQDLMVDAVTGATITSCAVVAAVDQALTVAAAERAE